MLQAGLALHQSTRVAANEIRGFICVAIQQRNTADNNNKRHSTAALGSCLDGLKVWAEVCKQEVKNAINPCMVQVRLGEKWGVKGGWLCREGVIGG